MQDDSRKIPQLLTVDGQKFALSRHRLQLLQKINAALETPLALLGLAWFCLMVLELSRGLNAMGEKITLLFRG